MKKLLLVFAAKTTNVQDDTWGRPKVSNAEVSGANGRKTDAIDY